MTADDLRKIITNEKNSDMFYNNDYISSLSDVLSKMSSYYKVELSMNNSFLKDNMLHHDINDKSTNHIYKRLNINKAYDILKVPGS